MTPPPDRDYKVPPDEEEGPLLRPGCFPISQIVHPETLQRSAHGVCGAEGVRGRNDRDDRDGRDDRERDDRKDDRAPPEDDDDLDFDWKVRALLQWGQSSCSGIYCQLQLA